MVLGRSLIPEAFWLGALVQPNGIETGGGTIVPSPSVTFGHLSEAVRVYPVARSQRPQERRNGSGTSRRAARSGQYCVGTVTILFRE